jgi:hypothetical protein
MAISYSTQQLSNTSSSAATHTISVSDGTVYNKHEFAITINTEANVSEVKLQFAVNTGRYADICDPVDETGSSIFLDGVFPNLRVSYTQIVASSTAVNVDVVQYKDF